MDSAFDTIAFLANSENRVEVLARLREGSHTRNELAEATSSTYRHGRSERRRIDF